MSIATQGEVKARVRAALSLHIIALSRVHSLLAQEDANDNQPATQELLAQAERVLAKATKQ